MSGDRCAASTPHTLVEGLELEDKRFAIVTWIRLHSERNRDTKPKLQIETKILRGLLRPGVLATLTLPHSQHPPLRTPSL